MAGVLFGVADEMTVNVSTKLSMDSGKVKTLKWKVKYRVRDFEDAQGLIARMSDPEDPDVTEATIIRDDLIDWSDLEGEGGDVPYDSDTLEQMLQHPEYRESLFGAWGEVQLKRLLPNRKN